jgi:uncharacterized membrane protein YeiH
MYPGWFIQGARPICEGGQQELIQPSVNQEALNALAEFKAYAAGTLLVLDLIGTFAFALSSGAAGVKERLDLFGVLVLSFAAASAGGIMRDLLLAEIPTVLRSELYAVAALAGAVVVVVGHVLNFPPTAIAIAGAVLCFGMRLIAIRRGWHLPVADLGQRSEAGADGADDQQEKAERP